MTDPSTLAFTLTYVGTLGLAFLMFLGQLAAWGALLAVAGILRLVAYPVQAASRPINKD